MPAAAARCASSSPTWRALAVLSPSADRMAASTLDSAIRTAEGDKTAKARQVGELLARRAAEAGIEAVVFDRGGYRYHGRIAALADGAREGGLKL